MTEKPSRRVTVRRGAATISYGPPTYGQPHIIGNAPLTAGGFTDLADALAAARKKWETGQ